MEIFNTIWYEWKNFGVKDFQSTYALRVSKIVIFYSPQVSNKLA